MADELLDLVDKNDQIIGTVWKDEAHNNPNLIHREIGVAIFHKNKILLQQRSQHKTKEPLAWKITVAGHVAAGENPKKAAQRELNEELGFKAELTFYKKDFVSQKKFNESRFFYVYYSVLTDIPIIKLNPREVASVRWVDINKIAEFAKENDYDLNGWSNTNIIEISKYLKII